MVSKKKSAFAIALLLALCVTCQTGCNSSDSAGEGSPNARSDELAVQQDSMDVQGELAQDVEDEQEAGNGESSEGKQSADEQADDPNDPYAHTGLTIKKQNGFESITWDTDENNIAVYLEREDVDYNTLRGFILGVSSGSHKVIFNAEVFPGSVSEDVLRANEEKYERLRELKVQCYQVKDDPQGLLDIYDEVLSICEPGVDYVAPESDG